MSLPACGASPFTHPRNSRHVGHAPLARPGARHPKPFGPPRRRLVVQASGADEGGLQRRKSQEFGLAPSKPKTPYGEMLQYYLKMEPTLFKTAVEDQLVKMRSEKEARQAAAEASPTTQDASQIMLYRRMEEVRANEVRATLEDLMYVSILEKFITVGVDMLPRMDGVIDVVPTNLKALTEGIHSKEALELVREHLMSVMGPASNAQFSNTLVKMSKFQMAQVYAASIMFGYFLRRMDKRFQLEKVVGSLEVSRDDAVVRLERLFAQASEDAPWEAGTSPSPADSSSSSQGGASSSLSGSEDDREVSTAEWLTGGNTNLPAKKRKSALRRYIEGFDQAAMMETARIVSYEGAALVERQTSAVLGDIKTLTAQVQEVVGPDVQSMEEVMVRMAKAVEVDAIETLTMTVGTQRRAVLEAVAFGAFLRDVESWVDTDYALLTIRQPLGLPGNSVDEDEE